MSRSLILMLLSSLALTTAACQSSQPQPADAPAAATPAGAREGATPDTVPASRAQTTAAGEAEEDVCADQQPTGDPPVCPSGCVWDEGKQRCTQLRGVIVDQRPGTLRPLPIPDIRPVKVPTP
ncbi:hypothetical protein WME75_04575 [Sorangium sp. So ce1014]|uniref:hypothetical protein n=1 Tax=Sorangium sp. So ce1014 TaxID=3133326 RepID=UPI003F5E0769